jgi:hypothetical protein
MDNSWSIHLYEPRILKTNFGQCRTASDLRELVARSANNEQYFDARPAWQFLTLLDIEGCTQDEIVLSRPEYNADALLHDP